MSYVPCQALFEDIAGVPYKFNVYDYKLKCDKYPLCYNFNLVDSFLNKTSVIAALGVAKESKHWKSCNAEVMALLLDDWMLDASPKIVELLEYNVSVLAYSGELDFMCNWVIFILFYLACRLEDMIGVQI